MEMVITFLKSLKDKRVSGQSLNFPKISNFAKSLKTQVHMIFQCLFFYSYSYLNVNNRHVAMKVIDTF